MCCTCGAGNQISGDKVCTDRDFPADESSLYTKEELEVDSTLVNKWPNTKWNTFHQYAADRRQDNFTFFGKLGISPNDISQGGIGNC